jgi:hypothetical protein
MIKLFKRIRQNLISKGNTGKYLTYAFGEIILVVIGILIALQINTWNEARKNKALEKSMLENLVQNLEQNSDKMKSHIKSINFYRKSGAVVLAAIENKLIDQDALEDQFHKALMNTSSVGLSETGYTVIKNNGFKIIRNQTLKNELMAFFEDTQPHLLGDLSWGTIDIADREKFVDEHFIQLSNENGLTYKPFNLERLLNNDYFIALVHKTDVQRGWFTIILERHLKDTQEMIKKIKEELNK